MNLRLRLSGSATVGELEKRRRRSSRKSESQKLLVFDFRSSAAIFNSAGLRMENIAVPRPFFPLQPTQEAPNFKTTAVVDGLFKQVSLDDYKGKYVVLFFYPLDFTFVCPTEIIAFSDRAEEFHKINCVVLACSTDSEYSHLAWINTPKRKGGLGEMHIPILADKTLQIARSYGVLREVDGLAYRGLFIIDGNRKIRQITINDLPVGRDVDETLRLVQAFQYTDKNGEVCPVNWRPGKKAMKATREGMNDYLEEHKEENIKEKHIEGN